MDVLQKAAVLLPHQAILENFVHTNPLAVLQDMDFFEAQEHVRGVLGYPSPGARLSSLMGSDPRKRAHAALVELAAVFLDRGAAKWSAPYRAKGFLYFFAELEAAVLFPPAWRAQARTGSLSLSGHSGLHSVAPWAICLQCGSRSSLRWHRRSRVPDRRYVTSP